MTGKNCLRNYFICFTVSRFANYILSFLFMTLLISNNSAAQNGEQLFLQTCSACHTIGGGRLVGPDLSGINKRFSDEWLIKWTKSSQTLINSGDSEAIAIYEEYNGLLMPDQNLTDAEILAIYAFIESNEGDSKTPPPAASNNSDFATPEQISSGQLIFTGNKPLTNGGASCISCHSITYKHVAPGGLLAKDLTTVYSRMGGDAGLAAIIKSPPFPAMAQAYKRHSVTDQETADLIAFFNKVNSDSDNQTTDAGNPLLILGFQSLLHYSY